MEGDNKESILLTLTPDDTKATIRTKVWDYMDSNKIAASPWPPHKRIPNYKNAKETSLKLLEVDVFKTAKSVKIDPDKPLQHVRFNALEQNKTVFVPTPRLISYFLNKLTPSENTQKNWSFSSKLGLINYSTPIDLENVEKIDLIIVGAVAVSPKGWRIGKGEGYSDLEYALMSVTGMIDANVKVIACVHDCQVINDIPDHLFEQFDVPVDFIVTPTRVIHCEGIDKPKPQEIYWNLLSVEKYNSIPVLKKIRYNLWKEDAAGLKLLKDESEAPKELVDEKIEPIKNIRRYQNQRGNYSRGREFYGNYRGRRQNNFRGGRGNFRNSVSDKNSRRQRRRDDSEKNDAGSKEKRTNSRDHDGSGDTGKEEDNEGGNMKRRNDNSRNRSYGKNFNNRRRLTSDNNNRYQRGFWNQGDGWVYIGNIPKNVRVSDFKVVVRNFEKVRPLRFVWKGAAGFAFLNFKTTSDAKEAADLMAGLKISDRLLKVELARERERNMTNRKGQQKNAVNEVNGDDKQSSVDNEVSNVAKDLEENLKVSHEDN